ncbi:SMP-30/gluconolactonase/LRE family protein [Microbacterium sp. X-17]|uniref:SMP-30/gluconolactonase/LRE family protein n=1 Tax=Microbacterium sp. X-17 TaxID=3144404 RepID=UPI0031F4AB06
MVIPRSALDAMAAFSLDESRFGHHGADLHRPECVLTTAAGELYVSDERGGVTRISADGSTTLYSAATLECPSLAANGFALMPDGSFLVAPLCGGGVFRLRRDGQAEPFLQEVDGRELRCANFVLLDPYERIWISCLTQQDRTTLASYPRGQHDGYIVLVDRHGARIVADDINYPNEVRIDAAGRYLYTNETTAGRLLRYPIAPDGSLGSPVTITEFDASNMLDGFTLDREGGAWVTAIISNRLWHVTPDGAQHLLIEQSDPEQMERLCALQRTTGVLRSVIYEEHGSTLRNMSSLAFGGPDLHTVFVGSLMGDSVLSFHAPVAGVEPAHWRFDAGVR